MQIFLRGMTGKIHTFEVEYFTPIEKLRLLVSLKTGISFKKVQLIFAGRQLVDHRTIGYYNIQKESTLHLSGRLDGYYSSMNLGELITMYFEEVEQIIKRKDPKLLKYTVKDGPSVFRAMRNGDRSDETFMLSFLKELRSLFFGTYHHRREDSERFERFMKHDAQTHIFPYLGDNLKDNEAFITKILQIYGQHIDVLLFSSDRLKNDIKLINKSLKIDPKRFSSCGLIFRDDPFKAGEVIRKHPSVFKHAGKGVRSDAHISFHACRSNTRNIKYLTKRLKNDCSFLLSLIHSNTYTLSDFPPKFLTDRSVVMKIVQINGLLLKDCKNFQDDEEIVILSIDECGYAFQFASSRLRKDKKVVMHAIKKCGSCIDYVSSDDFRDDFEFALEAVKSEGSSITYFHEKYRNDRRIVTAAVQQDGMSLQFTPNFCGDRDIVSFAVRQNGMSLEFADESFSNDKEIVLDAIRQTKGQIILHYVYLIHPNLRRDEDVLFEAVLQDYSITKLLTPEETSNIEHKLTKENVMMIVSQHPHFFRTIKSKFRNDRDVVMSFLKVARGSILGSQFFYFYKESSSFVVDSSDLEMIQSIVYSFPMKLEIVKDEILKCDDCDPVFIELMKIALISTTKEDENVFFRRKVVIPLCGSKFEDKQFIIDVVSSCPEFYDHIPKIYIDDGDVFKAKFCTKVITEICKRDEMKRVEFLLDYCKDDEIVFSMVCSELTITGHENNEVKKVWMCKSFL